MIFVLWYPRGGDILNKRIAHVRRENGLNQQEFADRIGLTKNFVSLIETGGRNPSDRTISDICRIFDIQEDWLRYGLEPMRAARSEEEEIAELVGQALKGSSDFKKAVIRMICTRTPEQLQALEDALRAVCESL
jgi:transcriptional regulator with XRE-family HTH domain